MRPRSVREGTIKAFAALESVTTVEALGSATTGSASDISDETFAEDLEGPCGPLKLAITKVMSSSIFIFFRHKGRDQRLLRVFPHISRVALPLGPPWGGRGSIGRT